MDEEKKRWKRITALVDAGVLKPVADDDVRVVVAPEEEAGELEMEIDAGAHKL